MLRFATSSLVSLSRPFRFNLSRRAVYCTNLRCAVCDFFSFLCVELCVFIPCNGSQACCFFQGWSSAIFIFHFLNRSIVSFFISSRVFLSLSFLPIRFKEPIFNSNQHIVFTCFLSFLFLFFIASFFPSFFISCFYSLLHPLFLLSLFLFPFFFNFFFLYSRHLSFFLSFFLSFYFDRCFLSPFFPTKNYTLSCISLTLFLYLSLSISLYLFLFLSHSTPVSLSFFIYLSLFLYLSLSLSLSSSISLILSLFLSLSLSSYSYLSIYFNVITEKIILSKVLEIA
ncbi:unnamed protein product [Acanthosepion pharaonis]|uniref:Uncharacterized protein n=1 Tax=Acanthosepion pharaonis TaxID=158019 RepID=A0A812E9H6_ACAPH|nr:unnamed protein product [Sepia pharaonis]